MKEISIPVLVSTLKQMGDTEMSLTKAAWLQREFKKTGCAALGLFICSFGSYLQVQAGIGLSPWNALNQGAAVHFGVTYGTAAAMISALVIVLDLLLREGIGIGSVLDTIIVGRCVDMFTDMKIVSMPDTLPLQIGLLLVGLTFSAVGMDVYMRAGLCCGPRDTLMVALAKRFRKVPIGAVNFVIFAGVMVLAILLGCVIGVGTVIAAFVNGPILQLVFGITNFDPCDVEHENFRQMLLHYMNINA